jgi:hypothetical protein
VQWTDTLIGIPRFAEHPSGLVLPVEVNRPTISGDGNQLADGTPVADDAFFIMANPPSSFEQMRVVLDESGLELPVSSLSELREMVAALSFEGAMVAISRLACHAWHIRGDTQAQLALAPEIFGDRDLTAAISRLVQRDPEHVEIFPEQHAAVLQRLLVLVGRDAKLGESREGEQSIFNRAWLAAATPSAELDRDAGDDPKDRQRWITYLIQNGTYNRVEDSLSSMIRPQILLSDIAATDAAQQNPHFCPVDEWHRESFGFSLSEQFALGLAISARSNIFSEETPVVERSIVGGHHMAHLAEKLGRDFDQAQELLSAPREWYRAEFEKREDTIANAAWDRIPFESRPLLRLSNEEFLTISPRALQSWMGDGFYHRTLSAARDRGQVERFQAFYGALVEEHVLQILRHAHPDTEPLGSCRVFGEQRYGRGEGKLSPDVAIDCGSDLVLFEVCSGRFTLRTIIEGSPEAALGDLGRLIFSKVDQLDRRVSDLLNEEWGLPEGDVQQVRRIWPVVVTADVLQNEMLWDEIRSRLASVFTQPKVQRLTLLDMSELEQLAALVEQGHGLVDLLQRKASGPYAELDFRRFVAETPNLSSDVRSSLLDERWFAEVARTAEILGLDITSADEVKARLEERMAA